MNYSILANDHHCQIRNNNLSFQNLVYVIGQRLNTYKYLHFVRGIWNLAIPIVYHPLKLPISISRQHNVSLLVVECVLNIRIATPKKMLKRTIKNLKDSDKFNILYFLGVKTHSHSTCFMFFSLFCHGNLRKFTVFLEGACFRCASPATGHETSVALLRNGEMGGEKWPWIYSNGLKNQPIWKLRREMIRNDVQV